MYTYTNMYLINSYRFGGAAPVNPDFTILVKTDNAGTSASDQFTIPTTGVGYNYDVDWGDGNTDTGVTGNITHTFSGGAGTYTVKISGLFPRIYFNRGGDSLKLLEIQNWGNIAWDDFNSAFDDCRYLDVTATDKPDLSNVTNMLEAFYRASGLGTATLLGDFSSYDFSNIQSLRLTFYQAYFNSDLGGLTGANNLNDMWQTFRQNVFFNTDISGWNVSGVTTMLSCFNGATSFNQNLGSWQLNSVTDLRFIFANSGMSTANYTDTIVGWANYVFVSGLPINVDMSSQTGRTFDTSRSGGANFANAGAARTYLTTATPTGAGWTISGDTVI